MYYSLSVASPLPTLHPLPDAQCSVKQVPTEEYGYCLLNQSSPNLVNHEPHLPCKSPYHHTEQVFLKCWKALTYRLTFKYLLQPRGCSGWSPVCHSLSILSCLVLVHPSLPSSLCLTSLQSSPKTSPYLIPHQIGLKSSALSPCTGLRAMSYSKTKPSSYSSGLHLLAQCLPCSMQLTNGC